MSITVITSKAQFDQFLSSAGAKPVFVDFMADWCGNCELILPTLEAKAAELEILHRDRLAKLADPAERQEEEEDFRRERRRIEERRDREIEKLRG